MRLLSVAALCALSFLALSAADAFADAVKMPFLRKSTAGATELVVDGKPFVMLAGELTNSGGSTARSMADRWENLVALNLNTVLIPVSWEQVEPEEGKYDFSHVYSLVAGARRHDMKLVLLWFGSWKNGSSGYAPYWVMGDTSRFPRMKNRDGRTLPYLSCFSPELVRAESRTFGRLMRHIGEIDRDHATVLMVQVENEVGLLGDSRDRSPRAEKMFSSEVPGAITRMLKANAGEVWPEITDEWKKRGARERGDWMTLFGNESNSLADEMFMAWHYARHIEAVAAAGKNEYPLPMLVNAWTIYPKDPVPGHYPSGGPNSRMMDVYMLAAPSVDIFAPDNYNEEYAATFAGYERRGNPVFVPEAVALFRGEKWSGPAKAFYTIAEHDGLCFSPFAIDNKLYEASAHPLGAAYKTLRELMPLIVRYRGTERMRGFMMETERNQTFDMVGYRLHVNYQSGVPYDGYGLVIQLSDNEFLVSGYNINVSFSSLDSKKKEVSYGLIREGSYEGGKWSTYRYLGGDEAMQGVGGVKMPPVYTDEERTPHMVTTVILKVIKVQ